MFILSATTHSAALLAALSAAASRVTEITKTTAEPKPAAMGDGMTGCRSGTNMVHTGSEQTRNSFRIVCPLKVNITLPKVAATCATAAPTAVASVAGASNAM